MPRLTGYHHLIHADNQRWRMEKGGAAAENLQKDNHNAKETKDATINGHSGFNRAKLCNREGLVPGVHTSEKKNQG